MLKKVFKYFLSTNFAPKRFEFNKDDKCLCIAPHQDDETIGMGGTISRFHKNFDVICLTNGAKGIKNLAKDEIIQIRKKEFECAMGLANIAHYDILNFEDRSLIEFYDDFSKIDFNKYDYIFIPNPIEQHKDHKAVCALLYKYLLENKNSKFKIAFYEVWSPLCATNITIDITNSVNTKEKMLDCYKSQCAQRGYKEAAMGLSAYRGLIKEQGAAEAFYLMDIKDFLQIISEIYFLGEEN